MRCIIRAFGSVMALIGIVDAARAGPLQDLDENIFYMMADDPRPVAADEKVPAMPGDAAPLANHAWWQALTLCSAHFGILSTSAGDGYPSNPPIERAEALRRANALKSLSAKLVARDRQIQLPMAAALLANTDAWESRLLTLAAMGRQPLGNATATCGQLMHKYREAHPLTAPPPVAK